MTLKSPGVGTAQIKLGRCLVTPEKNNTDIVPTVALSPLSIHPPPPRKRANVYGPTSRRKSVFKFLVCLRVKESTELAARTQALIDFKPRRLKDSATAIRLQGGEALVMTHSSKASIPRFRNTRLILREKHVDPGVLINSRSKTRSSID